MAGCYTKFNVHEIADLLRKAQKAKAARFLLAGGDIRKGYGGGSVLAPDGL